MSYLLSFVISVNCQINYAAHLIQCHRILLMVVHRNLVTFLGQMVLSLPRTLLHLTSPLPHHPLVEAVALKSGAILIYAAALVTTRPLKLPLNHRFNSNRYKLTANCPLVTMITIATFSATFILLTVVE